MTNVSTKFYHCRFQTWIKLHTKMEHMTWLWNIWVVTTQTSFYSLNFILYDCIQQTKTISSGIIISNLAFLKMFRFIKKINAVYFCNQSCIYDLQVVKSCAIYPCPRISTGCCISVDNIDSYSFWRHFWKNAILVDAVQNTWGCFVQKRNSIRPIRQSPRLLILYAYG